jgi:predicted component of type VI protein secretion system
LVVPIAIAAASAAISASIAATAAVTTAAAAIATTTAAVTTTPTAVATPTTAVATTTTAIAIATTATTALAAISTATSISASSSAAAAAPAAPGPRLRNIRANLPPLELAAMDTIHRLLGFLFTPIFNKAEPPRAVVVVLRHIRADHVPKLAPDIEKLVFRHGKRKVADVNCLA